MSWRFRIWCNQPLPDLARDALLRATSGHEVTLARQTISSNLADGASDPAARESDILFGQPDPLDILQSAAVKWIHLSTAGYTRYDRADVREALQRRGAAMTTSSTVYADPCAQHLLAMMLGLSRQLPQALGSQQARSWDYEQLRAKVRVLGGDAVLIVGLGAIGRRLVELLQPFDLNLLALRRRVRGDEPVPTRTMESILHLLPDADHIVNLLPSAQETSGYFDETLFGVMKRTARFYNVGRGDTVDQEALAAALQAGKLAAAYLDVTAPEPLPPDHPLWTAPNCFITPHIAGGHQNEQERLVEHFLINFRMFCNQRALLDRIV